MSGSDPLDVLLGGVREEMHARADAGGRVRDFAAMIARANALSPTAVPDERVDEASRFAPVVALRSSRPPAAVAGGRPAAAARRGGPRWLVAAGVLLVAAAGSVGAARLVRQDRGSPAAQALPLVGRPVVDAAPLVGPPPERSGPGSANSPRGHVEKNMSPETDVSVADEAPAADASAAEPGDDDASGLVTASRPAEAARPRRDGAPRRGPRPAASDAWETLDAAARAAWRRGDLPEARALLTALVRSPARAARIELAYGDLFVLARQSGDLQELARLWRAYLERFPRGLYAEDARVGLCRREERPARRACWELYLETWPEGPHADEAREAM